MPTINELKMLENLPFEVKVAKSKLRIEEWYRYYGGNVYVSFSGGKDSTVLLHLVRSLFPDVPAVFIPTCDYPEIIEFVKQTDNVTWVYPKMKFKEIINKYGYPVVSKEQSQFIYEIRTSKSEKLKNTRINGNKSGRGKVSAKWKYLIKAPFKISHMCCNIMKKTPAKKYEKQTGQHPYIGTLASESSLRKTEYLEHGCNAFSKSRPVSTPLGFWRDQDIWKYLKKYNVPYSDIYNKGYTRTGCLYCMYGIQNEKGENRFQRMQKTHPKQYDYCMNTLGLKNILDYMGIPYESQVTLDDIMA